MSILNVPSDAEATGLTAEIYADDIRSMGHVPSYTRALSLNPEAYVDRRRNPGNSGIPANAGIPHVTPDVTSV